MAINSLLNIGNTALTASQASITVTGNNIANVNTEGYSRQYVVQTDAAALTMRPGQQGQGVKAQEIMRRFSSFLEKSYVQQSSLTSRWSEQSTVMQSVENIFNEANRTGISSQMNTFFKGWQDLSLRPEDTATRTDLISQADSLALLMRDSVAAIKNIQRDMNTAIDDQVKKTNELVTSIAEVNAQIEANTIAGMSNPNSLMDKRDSLTRQLAECLDIEVQDRGGGDYSISTANGMPLLEGNKTYSIEVMPSYSESNLTTGSDFKGEIKFQGTDSHEYTVEMVKGGTAGKAGDPNNPTFRVSLDGGKTWLKDDDGNELNYEVTYSGAAGTDGETDPVQVKNLKISFTSAQNLAGQADNDPTRNDPSNPAGDRFTVVPKEGLYWISPSKGPQNITPQIYFDGTDNTSRVHGGKLAAYYNVRDDNCGRYIDELDAVSNSLIWEVNRLHSQGVGTSNLTYAQGNYPVDGRDIPLGMAQSGLPYWDRLESGNVNLFVYDDKGELLIEKPIDFTGLGTPAGNDSNFDPERHSLADVRDAINNTYGGKLQADIIDQQLVLTAAKDTTFACGSDTSGLMAALGINTFFAGSKAEDIAVSDDVRNDLTRLAAASVDGQQQVNDGDNTTAQAIAALAEQAVRISTTWKTSKGLSLNTYYNNTVAVVGADTRACKLNSEYNTALSQDLDDRASAVSGVSLDEEMSNLIKFQHSYTAAAKLITTADQMIQTILGLKQ